jgi:hypothetical protein
MRPTVAPIYLPKARSMVIAALLKESAARLRLDAAEGTPGGSVAVAELADELAENLLRSRVVRRRCRRRIPACTG